MVLLRSKRVPYALSVARSVTEQLTASCYLGVMEHLRSHGNNFVSIISPTPIKPISVSFPFQRHCPSATNRIHQYASRRCNESVSSTYRKSSLLFVSFLSSCLISACWIQERNIWISEWKRRLHRKYLIPSDFACFEASSPDTFWQIASLERASYEVISHRHRRNNYGRSSGIFFHYLSLSVCGPLNYKPSPSIFGPAWFRQLISLASLSLSLSCFDESRQQLDSKDSINIGPKTTCSRGRRGKIGSSMERESIPFDSWLGVAWQCRQKRKHLKLVVWCQEKKRDYKRFVGFVDSVMQLETIAQFNAMSLNISNIHFFSYSWFDYFP